MNFENGEMIFDTLDRNTQTGFMVDAYRDNAVPSNILIVLKALGQEADRSLSLPIKLESDDDYARLASELKTNKSRDAKLDEHEEYLLEPLEMIRKHILTCFYPIKEKYVVLIKREKDALKEYKQKKELEVVKEQDENQKKADDEAVKVREELTKKAEEQNRESKTLEEKKKIELEKARELKIKEDEEKENARIAAQKLKDEEAKREAAKDLAEKEEIQREVDRLAKEKTTAEDIAKKIAEEVTNQDNVIKVIAKEEIQSKRKAKRLDTCSKTYTVKPEMTITKFAPKIAGIVYRTYLKYRIVNKPDVPDYWKMIDDEKVKAALKVQGRELQIPGIEIYEETGVSSSKN